MANKLNIQKILNFDWKHKPFALFQVACGSNIHYESKTDDTLSEKLFSLAEDMKFPVAIGNTISTNDYYEGML